MILLKSPRWWDGALWFRTYSPGGYDGYKTISGRKLPCGTLATAIRRPDMHDEIRRLSEYGRRR